MRELAFPQAKSFADLFEASSRAKGVLKGDPWTFEDYKIRTGKRKMETIQIGPFCQVSSKGYDSFDVRAKPEVYDFIRSSMIAAGPNDQITFKIVVRSDDEALVCAENSTIIGSRWLALIDPRTIPQAPAEVS